MALPLTEAAALSARKGAAAFMRGAGIPLLLVGTLWVARYWHSPSFGLYEDDLTIIPRAVLLPAAELLRFVYEYIVRLYGHARPLSDSLIYLLSSLGWRLGGLQGIYVIGYVVESVNVLLFYALLKRLDPRPALAAIGGLAYALFSADTTQAFLTHSLGLQPSLTLLLVALHAWLSNRKLWAYGLAFVILFAYETPFPMFLAAPFLDPPSRERMGKALWAHVAITGSILAAAVAIKALAGEERVSELGIAEAVLTPLNHMIVGPAVSAATLALRPVEAVIGWSPEVVAFTLVALAVFAWAIARHDPGKSDAWAAALAWLQGITRFRKSGSLRERSRSRQMTPDAPRWVHLAGAGLAMWILAYPLTYTTRGYHIRGRPTRVHLAAGLGSSLVIAAVATALVQSAATPSRRRWALVTLAAWFGTLTGYGLVLQADYTLAWRLEKDFWNRLLPLVEDVEDGSVILIDPSGIQDTYQIAANTWNLPEVLPQIVMFPADWREPPRVYRLAPDWETTILGEDGLLTLDERTIVASSSFFQGKPSSQVILIETDGDPWTRIQGPLELETNEIPLKPVGTPILGGLGRGLLGGLLEIPEPASQGRQLDSRQGSHEGTSGSRSIQRQGGGPAYAWKGGRL
jgi:hypothetical protein